MGLKVNKQAKKRHAEEKGMNLLLMLFASKTPTLYRNVQTIGGRRGTSRFSPKTKQLLQRHRWRRSRFLFLFVSLRRLFVPLRSCQCENNKVGEITVNTVIASHDKLHLSITPWPKHKKKKHNSPAAYGKKSSSIGPKSPFPKLMTTNWA